MEAKGRQRFEDLRADFETKALTARKASKTLKNHADLKDLTKRQLCDLVWARIENLHTKLHEKDDLSRMVRPYPEIKSTYFRLESDSATLTNELKALLQSRNLIATDEEAELVSEIRTEYIDLKLGAAQRDS